MFSKKLLYRINREVISSQLNYRDISGNEKEELANFFRTEGNLEKVFSGLIPLEFEFRIPKGSKLEKGSVLDALCLNPKNKILFIVEYKSVKEELLSQIARYSKALDKNLDERVKLSKIVNKKVPSPAGDWGYWFDEIKWEKTKVICIAPDFYEYEIDFADEEKTIWIKAEWYGEKNGDNVLRLEMNDEDFLELTTNIVEPSKFYNLERLLEKLQPSPKKESKKWILKIDDFFVKELSLTRKINRESKYADYNSLRYFYNKKPLFYVRLNKIGSKKEHVRILLNITSTSSLTNNIELGEVSSADRWYWNLANKLIQIENEASFKKSFDLLKTHLNDNL